MTQKLITCLALLLALCLLSAPVCAFAQDAALMYQTGENPNFDFPGFSIARTEDDQKAEDFAQQVKAVVTGLAASEEAPNDGDSFFSRLSEQISPLLKDFSGEEERALLGEAVALTVTEAFGGDESLSSELADLIALSRMSAPEESEIAFLVISPSASAGGEAFVGTSGADRFVSLFTFGPTGGDGLSVTSQLVYTEWGLMIAQSNPKTGVIRPDGSFAVLEPGETYISLMDSGSLAELDRFTLTVLPSEEGSLEITADGESADGLTLKIGETVQLAALFESPREHLSSIERITPDGEEARLSPLPEAIQNRVGASVLIPSLPPQDKSRPQRILQILG